MHKHLFLMYISCMVMCAYCCRYIAMHMYCYATYGYDKIHMQIANGHTHMCVVMLACVSMHMCNTVWLYEHMHLQVRTKMQCRIGGRAFRNVISHFRFFQIAWKCLQLSFRCILQLADKSITMQISKIDIFINLNYFK